MAHHLTIRVPGIPNVRRGGQTFVFHKRVPDLKQVTIRGWSECLQRDCLTLRVNRKQADMAIKVAQRGTCHVSPTSAECGITISANPLSLPFVMNSERSALLPAMLRTENGSAYTLDTVHFSRPPTPSSHGSTPSYGSIPHSERTSPSGSRDIIVRAGLKMALIFAVSCVILGGTLWLALPTLDE